MKILCVIDNLGSGGAQRQMVELAIAFKRNGNEVSFLTYYPLDFYNARLAAHFIPAECIPEAGYLQRCWRMRKYIRSGKFDIVLSFLSTPSFICEIAAFPFRRWKLVVGERSANPNIRSSVKERIYRIFHIVPEKIICNSHANARLIKRVNPFLSGRKIEVIYNLVDQAKWRPFPGYVPRRDGKLRMVVAASHRYLKNFADLIQAVNLLSPGERQLISIDWYGDKTVPPYYDNSLPEARKLIEAYHLQSIFSIHKATSDIDLLLGQFDILGLFSSFEGFPNAICEAMASSKPIISTRVSDIPMIVKDGINGFLCDPHDIHSIANALRRAINLSPDSFLKMGELNRAIALKLFDKDSVERRYLQIFEEILTNSH